MRAKKKLFIALVFGITLIGCRVATQEVQVTEQGIHIYMFEDAIPDSVGEERLSSLLEHLGNYTDLLISRLQQADDRSLPWLDNVQVYIMNRDYSRAQGKYNPQLNIILFLPDADIDYSMLATYGHEFVRVYYNFEISRSEALTSSLLDREPGGIGESWDIADQLAADMEAVR